MSYSYLLKVSFIFNAKKMKARMAIDAKTPIAPMLSAQDIIIIPITIKIQPIIVFIVSMLFVFDG